VQHGSGNYVYVPIVPCDSSTPTDQNQHGRHGAGGGSTFRQDILRAYQYDRALCITSSLTGGVIWFTEELRIMVSEAANDSAMFEHR